MHCRLFCVGVCSAWALLLGLFAAVSISSAQTINVSNWTSAVQSGQVVLTGNAATSETNLVITPDILDQKGAAFFATPIDVSEDFDVSFSYLATASTGCSNAADGVVLTFQPYSPNYFGLPGIWLGLEPNSKFFGIFVDAYGNGPSVGDVGGLAGVWHVGLSRSYQVYWKWQLGTTPEFCGTGSPTTVRATYIANNLNIWVNGVLYSTLNTTLSLASLIGQRTAYIGFTGSTGGLRMRQEITSFSYATSSSDICSSRTTCKACAAAQCHWCDGVCTLRNTNSSICSRTCPITRAIPVAPVSVVATPAQQAPVDVCSLRTDCGSCTVDGRCTWSTASKRNGICSARKLTDRIGLKTFLTPSQCSAVCALQTTCSDCATKDAFGCGWCSDPAKGKPSCTLKSTSATSCKSPLIIRGCHDMGSCKISVLNPAVIGSSIQATVRVKFAYSGPGNVSHDWNMVSTYRNAKGAVIHRAPVVSTLQRALPLYQPAAKFRSISFDRLVSVPVHVNGTPEVSVDLRPTDFVAASGFRSCITSMPLVSFPKKNPGVYLTVSPGSGYIRRAITFAVRVALKDTSPASLWAVAQATFTWSGKPINPSLSGGVYSFSIGADAITAPGKHNIVANITFNTPLGVRVSTATYAVKFMDPSRLIADSAMFSGGRMTDDLDEGGVSFSGGWFLTMGTSKDALIPFEFGGKFEFNLEMELKYGFSSRGVGSVKFEASVSATFAKIIRGTGGAMISLLYSKENGIWQQRQRIFGGFLDIRRVFAPKFPASFPRFMKDSIRLELTVGGGLRAMIDWKAHPFAKGCSGSGTWRRCQVSLTPYLSATASAKVGGRWAGAEVYGSVEMSATLLLTPFDFGGLGFKFTFGARIWALFFSLRFEFSQTFCILGRDCRKRMVDSELINPTEYSIPLKLSDPGNFFDTPRPTVASDYVVLDENIDAASNPIWTLNSIVRDYALGIYAFRYANDSKPQNFRLRAVWVESPAIGDINFSEPTDLDDLYDPNSADTSPAVAWLPKTDREFVLVWTRDTNASWVHSAPVVNGSVRCTPEHVTSAFTTSQLFWAYFRPGRGWQNRGALTAGSSFSTGAVLSDTSVIHPVNQPVLVAYEESQVSISENDLRFSNAFLRLRKFDASSIEMSAVASLSWPISSTASNLIVRSYNRIHLVGYMLKNEDTERMQGFLRFADWDTTAAQPTVPSIMSQAGLNGIALPECPNNASMANLFAVAWPRNTSTEAFSPSDLRFLVGFNCERSLFVGIVNPSISSAPVFIEAEKLASDIGSISYSQNGSHLTFVWYGRETEIKSSAYYTKTMSYGSPAVFPPTVAMFISAPLSRRVRLTALEDSFSVAYMKGSYMTALSRDNLYDRDLRTMQPNETANIVTRRLVAAVIDLTQPSQLVHNITCTSAELVVSEAGVEGSFVKAACISTFVGEAPFRITYGNIPFDENELIGEGMGTLTTGSNEVLVPVSLSDLSGGVIAITAAHPEVPITVAARVQVPIPQVDLDFVADSVFQVGTGVPVQINCDVVNRGLLPGSFVLRAYNENDRGAFVGELVDDEVLGFNSQRTKSLVLFGIDEPGDYSIRIELFASSMDLVPSSSQSVDVFVAPSEQMHLHASAIELVNRDVIVHIPEGDFSPHAFYLVDLGTDQEVTSVTVDAFPESQTVTLPIGSNIGPFAVAYGPDYAKSDVTQTLSRLSILPVRSSRFFPVFSATNSSLLRLGVEYERPLSSLFPIRSTIQVPVLSSPWGLVVTASASAGRADFTLSASEFVPVSSPSGVPRSQRLGNSPIFAAFQPFSASFQPTSLNMLVSASSPSATVRMRASLAQYFHLSNSSRTQLTVDGGAPIFIALAVKSSGDLRVSAERELAGARVFASTANFVLGSDQGVAEVQRIISRSQQSFAIVGDEDEFGNVNTTSIQLPRIRTSWTIPVVSGSSYYVSLHPGPVGGGPIVLDVDTSSLTVAATASCAIDPLSSQREPAVSITHDQVSNFTEIAVTFADEDLESARARLDDLIVTFDGPAPHCDFRLRDPQLNSVWTSSIVPSNSLGCRRIQFTSILPIETILGCLSSVGGGFFSGTARVERAYVLSAEMQGSGAVKRSVDGQIVASYFSTSTVSIQIAPPTVAPIDIPIHAPVNSPTAEPQNPPVSPPVAAPVSNRPAEAPVGVPTSTMTEKPLVAPVSILQSVPASQQSASTSNGFNTADPAVIGLLSFLVVIVLILIFAVLVAIYVWYKRGRRVPLFATGLKEIKPSSSARNSARAPLTSRSDRNTKSGRGDESEPTSSSTDSADSHEEF